MFTVHVRSFKSLSASSVAREDACDITAHLEGIGTQHWRRFHTASRGCTWLEELLLTFCACPACLHLYEASEQTSCTLSDLSLAGQVALDLRTYLAGIVTQQ